MSDPVAQLDYAPAPPWRRRRWFRRTVIVVCVLAFAAAAWRWGPEKWQRAKLLYWQHQCLNYSPPADEVAYDQEREGSSALINVEGYESFAPYWFDWRDKVAAARIPACWLKYNYHIWENPKAWISNRPSSPVLFMHERVTKSGRRYLVIVEGRPLVIDPAERVGSLGACTEVLRTGTMFLKPKWFGGGLIARDDFAAERPLTKLQIFAGQPDPNNSAHFTIEYIEDGRRGVVDGVLLDEPPEPQHGEPEWRAYVTLEDRNSRKG